MKSVARHIRCYGVTSISVDIFDTLLLRAVPNERERYERIAERWQPLLGEHGIRIPPRHVALWRQWVTSVLQDAAADRGGEAFLDDIIEALVRRLAFQCGSTISPQSMPILLRKLAYAELAEEKTMLRLHTSLISVLREFQRGGGKVYFISDMYLRGEHVAHLLGHFGVYDLFDGGVTSSDLQGGKGTGKPFRMLLNREIFPMINHSRHLHIGDCPQADLAIPRSHGIQAIRVRSSYVRWKRSLGQLRRILHAFEEIIQRIAMQRSFIRCMRHSTAALPDPICTLCGIGVRMSVPLAYFFAYTAEYVRVSRRRPVFCSGEVYRFMKMYHQWGGGNDALGWGFLRRIDAIRALFHRIITTQNYSLHPTALRWLIVEAETPSRLLEALGMSPERSSLADVLLRYAFDAPGSLDTQMREAQWVAHFSRYILEDSDCKRVLCEAEATLHAALLHLKANGCDEILLVDVGWNGTIQSFLQQYMRLLGYRDTVRGLYFGVTGEATSLGCSLPMRGVLVQNSHRHPYASGLFVKALWEYLLAPPAAEDFKYRIIWQGIDEAMAFLRRQSLPPHIFLRSLFPTVLRFLERPRRSEIDLIGRIMFDEGLQRKAVYPIADLSMPLHRVWRRFLRHPRRYWRTMIAKQQWRHGFLRWYRLHPLSWGLRIRSRWTPWKPMRSPFR